MVKVVFLLNTYLNLKLIFYKGGEICYYANQEFRLNKYTKTKICGIPTVEQLRTALTEGQNSDARVQLQMLFDESTFVETNAYTKRAITDFYTTEKTNELEGVITGYGAIDGKLVFAFAEDATRMGGVIDERHAKKIADLYSLAIKSSAPVIGIFNSNGTDIFEGTAGLAAYGRIMSSVIEASGAIPQIAFVSGKCIGCAAAIAAMFDFIVKDTAAAFYVSSPSLTGIENAQDAILAYTGETAQCAGYIRSLVSFLPDSSATGIIVGECADNLNRKLGDLDFAGEALSAISTIVDNGFFYEISHDFAPEATTVLATVGGVKCGIVANSFAANEGRLSVASAKKIAKFVNFCNAFSIPLVTLVDSNGLVVEKANETEFFAPELAKLAFAYSTSKMPKVTVILGHAIGSSFVLLGSKALGADLVYAVNKAEIGALSAESGVAFSWNDHITLEETRDSLIASWKESVSSPVVAAASGEIDDIISINELRARICSALLMLTSKGAVKISDRKILPL